MNETLYSIATTVNKTRTFIMFDIDWTLMQAHDALDFLGEIAAKELELLDELQRDGTMTADEAKHHRKCSLHDFMRRADMIPAEKLIAP